MNRTRFGVWVSLGVVLMLAAGTIALAAVDRQPFATEANISWAQGVLVGDGYLEQGSFEPGVLDHETRQALSKYQSDHALNDSGLLDEETYHSLTSHETAYPWGPAPQAAPTALAEPEVSEPAEVVEVAEAPAVPEPAPAPVAAEADSQEAAPAEDAAPAMPATGSNLPLLAISGLALLGTGALLLKRSA